MQPPFVPLPEIYQWVVAKRSEMMALDLPEKDRSLHGSGQKKDREKWQAFLFAVTYSNCFRLYNMCVQMEPVENCAHDATLRWFDGVKDQFQKIQLKELVPHHVTDEADLQALITEKLPHFGPSRDVAFVMFMNRVGYQPSVMLPDHQMGGVWFFCFSQPDNSEMFLKGYDGRHHFDGNVHYGTPAK